MKKQIALTALLTLTAIASHAEYKCVLENKPLKTSPLIVVESAQEGGKNQTVTIYKSKDSYEKILTVNAKDKTEDVMALLENKKEHFSLSFFMDEADALGMSEGTIKSSVANGNIRCLYTE